MTVAKWARLNALSCCSAELTSCWATIQRVEADLLEEGVKPFPISQAGLSAYHLSNLIKQRLFRGVSLRTDANRTEVGLAPTAAQESARRAFGHGFDPSDRRRPLRAGPIQLHGRSDTRGVAQRASNEGGQPYSWQAHAEVKNLENHAACSSSQRPCTIKIGSSHGVQSALSAALTQSQEDDQ